MVCHSCELIGFSQRSTFVRMKCWWWGHCFCHNQIRKMKMPGRENKTAVVVGTVTDDVRIQDIPKLTVRLSARFFHTQNNAFAWFWWCSGVIHNRSAPSKSPTVLAAGSWRLVVRWWPSTSWRWLPPKERAQFCSQVAKWFIYFFSVCLFVVLWCKYLPLAINDYIREKEVVFFEVKKINNCALYYVIWLLFSPVRTLEMPVFQIQNIVLVILPWEWKNKY